MVLQMMKLRRQLRMFKLTLWIELISTINRFIGFLNNISESMISMGESMFAEIKKGDDAILTLTAKEETTDESA